MNLTLENIFPCALVYLDSTIPKTSIGKDKGPLSYAYQAISLNKTLQHAGMPRLNIFTNEPNILQDVFSSIPNHSKPFLYHFSTSTNVPPTARFYAAHFKLDVMDAVSRKAPADALALLLDTDVIAMKPLSSTIIQRCATVGVGAFDISDQVFPAYGCERVIADLERVAGIKLMNPRWYGGEFLAATPTFLATLVQRARLHYGNYVDAIEELHHQGDEIFISAALNSLSDEGQQIIDVGAYQVVGRHWRGNTHRDMRWFRNCAMIHLPSGKHLIEQESQSSDFNPKHFFSRVHRAHLTGRARFCVKLLLRR